MIRESTASSEKSSDVRRCYVCVVRHTVVMTLPPINLNLAGVLNKRLLEQIGDGPLETYRCVLNEKVNVTLNNRGFRTFYLCSVSTYEQVKKDLSHFYPKRMVGNVRIHTQPLNL